MKWILLVGISTCVLVSNCCSNCTNIDNEMHAAYEKAKNTYPVSTDFLPLLESGEVAHLGVSFPEKERGAMSRHIYLLMKYPKSKMDSVRHYAYNNSIADYRFTDSCLLIVDYSPDEIKHFENFRYIPDTLHQIPIPNFDFLQDREGVGDYEKNAIIYVLGWGRGSIMDEDLLRSDRAGLPDRWRHGFTKGVTIWDNYVAYWLDVW